MNFEVNSIYHGFRLLEETEVNEIKSNARIFEHVKSGARLLHLESEDDNKVFSVAFRTPPSDDTGVPHILEHSVLCGSRKFKTKDPFTDLAKSSLQTFLNAMTFSDKTMYPISSKNYSDFINLMDVYLDAVFYPNIYKKHDILRQEGWRYELEPETEKLIYKGVVYSEMQGAMSAPEEVLTSNILGSLFPNTTYACNAGGDPEFIPDLTQRDFEEFHSKFYHPVNSYIFLYGDQDLLKCLKFIDENYLKDFEKIEVDSSIDEIKPFNSMQEKVSEYSISEEEEDNNKTYLALNFVGEERSNGEAHLAHDILVNMLISSTASPIRKALLDAEIGESILTYDEIYPDDAIKSVFSIAVKNTSEDKKEEFKKIVFDTLKSMVDEGIERKLIEASINSIEFDLREGDPWGIANKGLIYNIKAMESWLYDSSPLIHFQYEEILNKIKASIKDNYFEKYIEKNILNNNHCSLVVLNPKKGLAAEKARKVEEKLQKYKETLSQDEIEVLKERNKKLKEYQMAPDSEEAKATIPQISIKEIRKEAKEIPQRISEEKGVTILEHNMPTNKISYINLLFDSSIIEEEDIYYLSLLSEVLGNVDTEFKSYGELSNEININTGGIHFYNNVFIERENVEVYHPKFVVNAKVLSENIITLYELINEIIMSSKFDNFKRIKEIIQEVKSKLQMDITNSGQDLAVRRAFSYFSEGHKYEDMLKGVAYYNFISDIEKNYDTMKEHIQSKLLKVYNTIFNKNNLIIGITGEEEYSQSSKSNISIILDNMKEDAVNKAEFKFEPSNDSEGLITPSNVQYVAKAFNFNKLGYEYTGKIRAMQNILTAEYLYTRVRLQGGAYGCFMVINKEGNLAFVSYRDPSLLETLQAYDEAPKFIEDLDISKKDMEKFIIGAIGSKLDKPLTPEMQGERAIENYICGITQKHIQEEKDELLNTSFEDIKAFVSMLRDGLKQNHCCVSGNEIKIKENKNVFDKVINLI